MKKRSDFVWKRFSFIMIIASIILVLWILLQKRPDSEPQGDYLEEESSQIEEQTDEPESVVVQIQDKAIEEVMYEALTYALESTKEADYEKALALFEEAAAKNHPVAQYFAGEMYFQGIGVKQDMEKATDYFSQSFANGCKYAFELYGKMLFLGESGIPQDYEKAASVLYSIAQESKEASCILGIMYTFGMGVPVNFDVANDYYLQAAEAGYDTAEAFQARIQDRLTGTEAVPSIERYPFVELQYTNQYSDISQKIEKYAEKLKESESYEAFHQELAALQIMDIDMATMITVFGKDNWLFQQNPNDGDAYHDYVGDNAYSEEELVSIAAHLQEQKTFVEDVGSKFILLIIPNKEVVYAEYMPTYIERVSEITKTDKLVEYLKENTDISIIYLKDMYNQYKENYQIYYKSDTHFNTQGSFLAIAELLNSQYQKQIALENTHFDIHMNNYCGDLGVMIGRHDRYNADCVYFMPETSALEEDKVEASLLLIGDSFSEFMNTQANYYFKGGVDHAMIMNYNYDFYQATKTMLVDKSPDIVVWECVERYIDRWK